MNYLQIIGFSLITIGTIISFIGSYQQSTKDDDFKSNITEYVEKKKDEQQPILKIIKVGPLIKDSCNFSIKNIGKETAIKPTLVFSDNSFPNAFTANGMQSIKEIPQGVEVTFNTNLFRGISILSTVPNEDKKYKDDLLANIDKYKKGETAFIPRFFLEYYFNNKKYKTETYMLLLEYDKGIVYFGSDD